MKILVFSDSHRALGNMYDAIAAENPDQILHLGDHYEDAEDLRAAYPSIAIQYVAGNCDYAYEVPTELTLCIGGVRIFMTHGHRYWVKSDVSRLLAAAKVQKAAIALFGHTHHPFLETIDGVTLLNPGASGYANGKAGYGRILIENGKFTCELMQFDS